MIVNAEQQSRADSVHAGLSVSSAEVQQAEDFLIAPHQFQRLTFFCVLVLDFAEVNSLAFCFFSIAFSALLTCAQQHRRCESSL